MLNTRFLFLFGVILLGVATYGQNRNLILQKNFFDNKYGKDVLLYVGKIYYPENDIVNGNPLWGEKGIYEGDIVIDGERFENKQLMYNIFSHDFILEFKDFNGAEKQIILAPDKIDSVFIDESIFIKNTISQIDNKFVQLVHDGKILCVLSWEKQKFVKQSTDQKGFYYTNEKSFKYLIYNKVLYSFKNRRELLKIFDKEYRNDIKQYISTNKISIKSINSKQLGQLVNYIEKNVN